MMMTLSLLLLLLQLPPFLAAPSSPFSFSCLLPPSYLTLPSSLPQLGRTRTVTRSLARCPISGVPALTRHLRDGHYGANRADLSPPRVQSNIIRVLAGIYLSFVFLIRPEVDSPSTWTPLRPGRGPFGPQE